MDYFTKDGSITTRANHLLKPFAKREIDVKELFKFINTMDVSGNISLPFADYLATIDNLPDDISNIIEHLVYTHQAPNGDIENVFLRGLEYYLYAKHDEVRPLIRQDIISNIQLLGELEGFEFPNSGDLSLSEKATYATILDHIKHYSMNIACGIYYGMFYDKTISKEKFDTIDKYCGKAISDYYLFILGRKKPIIRKMPENILKTYSNVQLPIHKPLARFGKWGGRKMNIRDLDHPGNILLYVGHFLDTNIQIDLVVNPLFGSFEVGHAIEQICASFNFKPIREKGFIRYSIYDEGHPIDILELISGLQNDYNTKTFKYMVYNTITLWY